MATVSEIVFDNLAAHLSRPENAEAVKRFDYHWSRFWEQMQEPLRAFGAQLQAVANSPPSVGYEPFFVAKGYGNVEARILARILVRRGRRVAFEERRRMPVLKAISFLATPDRKPSAVLIRAKILFAAWQETSITEAIFEKCRFANVHEFVGLLERAAEGSAFDRDRLTQIAASVAAVAKARRGPKVAPASAAHEMFVESARTDGANGYTFDPIEGEFTDPVTEATRLEFGLKKFDPRPACARANGRRSNRVRPRVGDRAN